MNPGGNVHPNSPFTGHTHRPCNPLGAIPPFQVESKCIHLEQYVSLQQRLILPSVPGGIKVRTPSTPTID